jgi:hypothetical protein
LTPTFTQMERRSAVGLTALLAAYVLVSCESVMGPVGVQSAKIVPAAPQPTSLGVNHHCADLFAQSEVQVAAVQGVWNCLEPAVQARYWGTGDQAVAETAAYFLAPATLVGCDKSVCVYSLPLEATTSAQAGVSETTMTVWLDSAGLVAYVAVPKPVR